MSNFYDRTIFGRVMAVQALHRPARWFSTRFWPRLWAVPLAKPGPAHPNPPNLLPPCVCWSASMEPHVGWVIAPMLVACIPFAHRVPPTVPGWQQGLQLGAPRPCPIKHPFQWLPTTTKLSNASYPSAIGLFVSSLRLLSYRKCGRFTVFGPGTGWLLVVNLPQPSWTLPICSPHTRPRVLQGRPVSGVASAPSLGPRTAFRDVTCAYLARVKIRKREIPARRWYKLTDVSSVL